MHTANPEADKRYNFTIFIHCLFFVICLVSNVSECFVIKKKICMYDSEFVV